MPKLKKRADGRYSRQVYLGLGEDGRRQYKTVYGSSPKEADEKALEVKIQMRKGIDVSADRDTFGEWADRWLKLKSREVAEKQYRCYKTSTDYLLNRLQLVPIGKVRTCDIQEILIDLADENPHTRKPSSKKVLSDLRMTASQIFRFAISNRVLDYNPASAVIIPSSAPVKKRRALTDEEIRWVTETPHRAQTAAMIMLYAGLRRGEVIPLTWDDIDLDSRTICVTKSVKMVDGRPVVKRGAKTAAGERVVDIPHVLVDFLRVKKAENCMNSEKVQIIRRLVCPSVAGEMMTDSAFDRMWESYLADLNLKHGDFRDMEKPPASKFSPSGVPFRIEKFTPHCLRHTFATLLYKAGVDVLTAKAQLGHADIKTTLQIYTHLDSQYKRNSMDKLDVFLSNDKEALKSSI